MAFQPTGMAPTKINSLQKINGIHYKWLVDTIFPKRINQNTQTALSPKNVIPPDEINHIKL